MMRRRADTGRDLVPDDGVELGIAKRGRQLIAFDPMDKGKRWVASDDYRLLEDWR